MKWFVVLVLCVLLHEDEALRSTVFYADNGFEQTVPFPVNRSLLFPNHA